MFDFLSKFFNNDKINSLPVDRFNTLFEKYSISDYIPYSIYDESNELFVHNDDTLGFCFEGIPRTSAGGATASAMNEILTKMPSNMYLQVFYYGSKNIKYALDIFKEEHMIRANKGGTDAELASGAIDNMLEFLKEKTDESLSPNMVTKLKNIRLFFSVNATPKAKKAEVIRFKNDLYNILQSNNFYPSAMNARQMFSLGYELFSPGADPDDYPSYDNSQFLNKQVVSPNATFLADDDYFQIGDDRCWINMTPQSISQHFHIWEFSMKLGDYMTESLNANQFNDTFFINVTVRKKPKSSTKATTRNHSTIATQNWGELFRKFVAVKKESMEIIDRIVEKQEDLYEFDMDVMVSGEDYKEASLNAQVIESFWNKAGDGMTKIKLERTKGIHHLAFLSGMPMCANDEFFYNLGGKFRTQFANQIAHMFPVEADTRGEGFNLPLMTRRGQLAFIDLYESNVNFNGYIVATSGAGKSVLLNMLAFMSWTRNDRIFVLDYDNSFTGLIEAVDGQYLDLNPDIKSISFNPFSEINSIEEMMEELPYLSTFIYLLGSSKSSQRAQEDEKLIKTELQQIILNQYNMFNNKVEITHIRDAILKEHGDDHRFNDFARQLGQYCKNGMYGAWFSGPCEFSMDKDMMAVEFKGVENHEDLREPLVLLLLYHIGKVMYSTDPNKPRIQIILDEAHRFLGKNPVMDDFIDQAYRRARKFNGSMIIATQGFDDIYSADGGLSKAGKVIVNNSSWKLFLKQTTPSVESMIKAEVFGFNETDKKKLRSVKTRKREYSEIYVISPEDEKSVMRLVMPKFFYYLTSTDQKDKKKIYEYQQKFDVGKIEAIRMIVKDERSPKKKKGLKQDEAA